MNYWTWNTICCSLVQKNEYCWQNPWNALFETGPSIPRSSSEQVLLYLSHKQNRWVDMLSTGRNDPADRSCVGICMHDIQQSRWRSYLGRNVSSLSNYNKAFIKRLFLEFTSSLLWINQRIRFHQRNKWIYFKIRYLWTSPKISNNNNNNYNLASYLSLSFYSLNRVSDSPLQSIVFCDCNMLKKSLWQPFH